MTPLPLRTRCPRFFQQFHHSRALSVSRLLARRLPPALMIATLILCCVRPAQGQLPIQEEQGISGFGLALRKLPTTGSVLYITAHPDDENNALVALLSRGLGYRTALLSLTRGDGGQNEIGPELFEALGLLRSEELMSIHRFDGAGQYFSRAFEFGYSFSVEETLQKWGREEILRDIVRVIREFRPDIVLTLNPGGPGGGQHHQASAILAAEAFLLAGDPAEFPEQIDEGLLPWRPMRLFQSPGLGMSSSSLGGDVRIDLGIYDPVLGETYAEFGARARGHHLSQGMNVLPRPGPLHAVFYLANSTVASDDLRSSFFDQIDVGLQRLTRLDGQLESSVILLDGYVNWALESYSRSDYASAVKAVMTGLDSVRKMQESTSGAEALFLLKQKENDFLEAAEKGHFLYFDLLTQSGVDGMATPGEEIEVRAVFSNRSEVDVAVESIELLMPDDYRILDKQSLNMSTTFRIKVGDSAAYSEPYWYRAPDGPDLFLVKDGYAGIEPFPTPPIRALLHFRSFGVSARLERTAQFQWFDPGAGRERRMQLKIIPALSVALSPQTSIVPIGQPREQRFKVTVTNNSTEAKQVLVKLAVPPGWSASPGSVPLSFGREMEAQTCTFSVRPPARLSPGEFRIEALATADGKSYGSWVQTISYPHVETRIQLNPSATRVVAAPVEIPSGLRVGYVMGVGDDVGTATEQLGASVTYLGEADLSSSDLGRFDVIITGVRAYLNRQDLIAYNSRLLEYVERGGHLVVQYNKYEFLANQYAPFPLSIGRPHDRVTVEESPVRLLEPAHPVFRYPNRIAEGDWNGWVQERGLYFLGEWDPRYKPLIELQDPWPYNNSPKRGALVVAEYGKGTYVYTGLAFFRQLPAGVPGAYRLWANIISLGRSRSGH